MSHNDFSFQGAGAIDRSEDSQRWKSLQRLSLDALDDAADYHTEDEGLIAAVNTALSLGMPLLLTGAAGVGKTQLAYRIAYELGCRTLFFPVKSTSEAQDLFYHVDHLRRLHAAQVERNRPRPITKITLENPKTIVEEQKSDSDPTDIRHFIRFQGLGLAILRAMQREQLEHHGLWRHAWPEHEKQIAGYGEQQPSVVLIDEIDKAPMDFCNDMLEEIRRLQFSVPELGSKPLSIFKNPDQPEDSEKQHRPQIIITSNSEKGLPEPFLRRCIYYDIPAPGKDVLRTIIDKRLMKQGALTTRISDQVQSQSLGFYLYLNQQSTLEKRPSTAVLLNWFLIMGQDANELGNDTQDNSRWLDLAGFCLLKHQQDQGRIESLYESWLTSKPSSKN